MKLADMQRDFRSWLVTASDDAASRLSGGSSAGLNVYQNNYRVQLISCLEASYPHVRTWLGEEAFLAAAIAHIDSHPPHAWTLDAYSGDFDGTLTSLYPDNPDVRELARIELALAQAFVAVDGDALTPDALAQTDWDAARLRLAPSLKILTATTNAADTWSAFQRNEALPESQMLAETAGVIVWRQQFTVFLEAVDALEYAAMLLIQKDGNFAGLCDMLVERLGEQEGIAKAGALLVNWISKEWLAETAA
ncbi:DNA-binding domain-containing protein [Dyella psychrodurans]|uniref:DUF2063 domain-containing protein n=1 Tax=Dyella psychrodurans TaxID=1927960 RepID=A0A370X1C0_9GAMM|nr:DNA-binding domain-containing protein [Dyella psychrodurans]RDS82051.1 DUF2063 domain-containing protein [Dyella psychrodurans]